jgi:hypothetical protein
VSDFVTGDPPPTLPYAKVPRGTAPIPVKVLAPDEWNLVLACLENVRDFVRDGLAPSQIGELVAASSDGSPEKILHGDGTWSAPVADDVSIAGEGTSSNPFHVVGEFTAGIVGGGVWAKPLIGHEYDDDFDEGATLDPAWEITTGSVGAAAIDPYAAFATGDSRISVNARRSNWLMLQPVANGVELLITKPIPDVPSDFAVWMRGCFNHRAAVEPVNNDFTFGLTLSADPFDESNRITVYINESDAGIIQVSFDKKVAGVGTTIGTTIDLAANDQTPFEGVLMQRFGGTNTYHAWAITNGGCCVYLGSTTFSPAVARVGFFAQNAATTAPGNMIVGVDFIRFVEGATFLP